ncbi:MAG: serine--tRNA ligase [Coxiellaceae bacterium]|nr:serine--tRNA ligase [Coxiellaceae bacterium]|tara:strand:+ start:2693 stop:3976 length:1284 start_codon:yes stop_codon:yes gene_type:complete
MLDPKCLRNDFDAVAKNLLKRQVQLDATTYHAMEKKRVELQATTQSLQAERNQRSKMIGQAKSKGEDVQEIIDQMSKINADLKAHEVQLDSLQEDIKAFQLLIPNLLHDSVPVGASEEDNLELRRWGNPRDYHFQVRDHVELGELTGSLDMERASKLSGSRFVVLQGQLAQLQRALAQFMLDMHTQSHGYTEVYVPYLVHSDSLLGTGQLPKFAEDIFSVEGESNLHLIPTAEVPLANLHRDEILDESLLPLKYVGQTPCFRSEAGSYGRDTRGMIRVHQFEKVEMVHLVKPEDSFEALEEITSHAEAILQQLELPYRVMVLCSGDVGFSSAKTYDLEVWLPGQSAYREISSCSNCTDFQSRRMMLRYRNATANKPSLLHTLNGSGLAVGRALVAVMENYQQEDGSIAIPAVLQPYMKGLKVIGTAR